MKRNSSSLLLIVFLFLSFINIECTKSENTRTPTAACNKWEVNDDCRCTCLTGPCCLQSGVHEATLCGDDARYASPGGTKTIVGSCSTTTRTYIRRL